MSRLAANKLLEKPSIGLPQECLEALKNRVFSKWITRPDVPYLGTAEYQDYRLRKQRGKV